jgi:hypothetical protein
VAARRRLLVPVGDDARPRWPRLLRGCSDDDARQRLGERNAERIARDGDRARRRWTAWTALYRELLLGPGSRKAGRPQTAELATR